MARPIQLKTHRVLINAPRELVFDEMSSVESGGLQCDYNGQTTVLSQDRNDISIECTTKAGWFTYTTVEEVTLEPPERITFKHLSGPLHYAREELVFKDVDGKTELVHTGEIIWRTFPVLGWLGGRLYAKRMFDRVIDKFMRQAKEKSEARAASESQAISSI